MSIIIGRPESLLDFSKMVEDGGDIPDVILSNELRQASEAISELRRRLSYAEKFCPQQDAK